MGARVANASMTAAERHERARKAHLAGAVNAVVARAPELSDAQRAKLQALFAPAEVA
jgi:hypothetical protein